MMERCALLDCTLRDGGYITNWQFGRETICGLMQGLVDAGLDYVECGYLNHIPYQEGSAIFSSIEQIAPFLPKDRKKSMLLAMADVTQFSTTDITPFTGESLDGIRVVFYKRQVEEALELCRAVVDNGYKLFVQPMVTIDYSIDEYAKLIGRINEINPYGVSIVDSFGYMGRSDVKCYFDLLDNMMRPDVIIGYHSHNNMQLALPTALDVFQYDTKRNVIVDASLYGIGRGAGNLNTEIIAQFYNQSIAGKYDISLLLKLLGKYILPIREQRTWGYSPYLLLTALYHSHPNFACYLLENHRISVEDFEGYLKMIPEDMRTKCRRPYVEELYERFIGQGDVDAE